jgi:lipopolysaccharide transport system ATP-binding protein
VGDQAFAAKAAKKLDELVGKSSILVLASHDPDLIERVCNRKLTLEHGRIISDETIQSREVSNP